MIKTARQYSSKGKKRKRWAEHFKALLNRQMPENSPDIMPARRDIPVSCDPPSQEEIKTAINQLNSGKAAGPDSIPPEAIKVEIANSANVLDTLFSRIWNNEEFPLDWKEGHLVKLPIKNRTQLL